MIPFSVELLNQPATVVIQSDSISKHAHRMLFQVPWWELALRLQNNAIIRHKCKQSNFMKNYSLLSQSWFDNLLFFSCVSGNFDSFLSSRFLSTNACHFYLKLNYNNKIYCLQSSIHLRPIFPSNKTSQLIYPFLPNVPF